jgi:hypothetical protein
MHRDAMPEANPAELARPDDVAERIARMIETAGDTPNGARLEASKWKEAS